MPCFIDGNQHTWEVDLDGLLLAELKDKAGVDIVQDGLFLLENREDVLTKALLVICREQITERKLTDSKFAKLLNGDTAERAIEAVRGAAQLFFRPSRWSEIQSRSKAHAELSEAFTPINAILKLPGLPSEVREMVTAFIQEKIGVGNSQSLMGNQSASGPDAIPSNAAGDSLAS